MSHVAPSPICGNGICEGGERCADAACAAPGCRVDCVYLVLPCPAGSSRFALGAAATGATAAAAATGECAGHGTCLSSSGACACYEAIGYTGAACDECAAGYLLDPASATCERLATSAAPTVAVPTAAPTATPTTVVEIGRSARQRDDDDIIGLHSPPYLLSAKTL